MSEYVMRILGNADGSPCLIGGLLVRDFDPDAYDGRGDVEVTADVDVARKFPNHEVAIIFWRQASNVMPLRDDGKPNRPLTAYTVEMIKVT